MRVLVTGAGGQVGRALSAVFHERGDDVLALDHAGLDITDPAAVEEVVRDFGPALIANPAAWTNVDGAEADEAGALALNAQAVGHLARAARAAGARLVTYSTDYVFDGTRPQGYVESDPTGPLSAYGRTKLAGERLVAAEFADLTYVVRTAWVYDEVGVNFPRLMLRLARERGTVQVVTDQVGCPTYAGDLARGTAELVDRCAPGLYHMAGTGSASWFEVAGAVFEEAGVECELNPVTSEVFVRPAPRPAWSILRTEKAGTPLLPAWRDGLRRCIEGMAVER